MLQVWGIPAAKLAYEQGSVVVADHWTHRWVLAELDSDGANYSFLGGNWTLSVDGEGRTVVASPIAMRGEPPWWLATYNATPLDAAASEAAIQGLLQGGIVEWAGIGPCEELGVLLIRPTGGRVWFVAHDVWRIPAVIGSWDAARRGDEALAGLRGATLLRVDRGEHDLALVLDRGSILAGTLPSLGQLGWSVTEEAARVSASDGIASSARDVKSLSSYFVPSRDSLSLVRPFETFVVAEPPEVDGIVISDVPKLRVRGANGHHQWVRADHFEGSTTLRGCWILWKVAPERALLSRDRTLEGDDHDDDGELNFPDADAGLVLNCEVYPWNCLKLELEDNRTLHIDMPWRAEVGGLKLDMESADEDVLRLEGLLTGARIQSIDVTSAAVRLMLDGQDFIVAYRPYGKDGVQP